MKLLVTSLLTLAVNSALANPAGQFIGRYSIAPMENCNMGVDASRTYIKLTTDRTGRKLLRINSYGLESRLTEIPVESGLIQTAGTRIEDNVTSRINVKWPTKNKMNVSVTTTAPHRNIQYSERFIVSIKGKKLTIRETQDNSPSRQSTCVLIRK